MNLKNMALQRKNKRLKNNLKESERIINQLNKELSDSEASIEHFLNLLDEQFQNRKKSIKLIDNAIIKINEGEIGEVEKLLNDAIELLK